jgi:hypothetical protein
MPECPDNGPKSIAVVGRLYSATIQNSRQRAHFYTSLAANGDAHGVPSPAGRRSQAEDRSEQNIDRLGPEQKGKIKIGDRTSLFLPSYIAMTAIFQTQSRKTARSRPIRQRIKHFFSSARRRVDQIDQLHNPRQSLYRADRKTAKPAQPRS